MRRMLAVLILVTGCAASSSGSPGTAPAPKVAQVQWEDYSPAVHQQIDSAISARDCASLQTAFSNADRNSDATRARTGHSNSALMEYIDAGMRSSGCYG